MIRLADWEKKLLPLSIVTSVQEAEKILERNEALLEAVRKNKAFEGSLGCPHCSRDCGDYRCSVCRWAEIKSRARKPCLHFKFDGVALNNVAQHNSKHSWYNSFIGISYGTTSETYHPISGKKIRANIFKFLKAHIKWAKRIIDGTYTAYYEKGK